jgi:hypothetical protein
MRVGVQYLSWLALGRVYRKLYSLGVELLILERTLLRASRCFFWAYSLRFLSMSLLPQMTFHIRINMYNLQSYWHSNIQIRPTPTPILGPSSIWRFPRRSSGKDWFFLSIP